MLPLQVYKKLYVSLKEHRRVEDDLRDLLGEILNEKYINTLQTRRLNPLHYAQKNFFSILFLAVYRAIGIEPEKRHYYGMLNHCLRGLVTGADNLLDDEYKEMLPLNFPEPAIRFKSIMHILLFDRFIVRITDAMAHRNLLGSADPARLQQKLFEALVPIGAEEALEEGGVRTILPPEKILSTVHMYKGGKLLCLAFAAPLLVESAFRPQLQAAEQGIYSIGIALQLIDDLTDFYEDIGHANHNYLVSSIFHRGSAEEKAALAKAQRQSAQDFPAIEAQYPESVTLIMEETIGEALHGFELLEQAGFRINRRQAYDLIKNLFVLRGVKQLLPFFPREQDIHLTLSHAAT
ncbi:MAG: class 1 isoprenoid biosynthesis enzyme [Thermodesulfobacteriota bacterium]